MSKLDLLYAKMLAAKEELKKAKKLSDEHDPNEDPYESEVEDDGTDRTFDPNDDADDWLKENDPDSVHGKPSDKKEEEYSEYDPSEDEDAHRAAIDEDMGGEEPVVPAQQAVAPQQAASEAVSGKPKKNSRWMQPTREELNEMRQHTRPWEVRARELQALNADPSKNPNLARHGNIVEARNTSHQDKDAAYNTLTQSPEYMKADPGSQYDMEDQFEQNWAKENPSHLKNALTAHKEAHEKGKGHKDAHAAAKDAQIRSIISGGGHGGEGYSVEEGMQHAGGTKGEAGTEATLMQDPAASYANGNQDFLRQYSKDYKNKAKKVNNIEDMQNYDEGAKRDIERIVGKGPTKNAKFEKFFEHYHPMIGHNAKKAISAMGLENNTDIDHGMLHEAGVHGLYQAINDYDHDDPSKASFATHAGNKIHGLQMTALKNQDAIPAEVRQAQKKFASNNAQPKPKVDLHSMISSSGHPKANDIVDRLQRVGSQRQAQATKVRKPQGTPGEGI